MLRKLRVVSVIVALVAGAHAVADDQPEDRGPFARGFGYVGAFWVTRSSDELRLFSNDLPLGARLSLQQDLGIDESYAVPRIKVGWRFGKRHILAGGYYDLSRSAIKRIARTIPLPEDNEIEAGVEVKTDFTFRVSKLQYTYLFHRDEKVTLGIGVGARLSASAFVGPIQEPEEPFNESVTAPLPVFGFCLSYWIHLRTSNPIESTFASVRLRKAKTEGCGSRIACLSMGFKLALSAQKRWRALNGAKLLADVIDGVVFEDGVRKKAA